MIYLDHQGSTPLRPHVLDAMLPHLTTEHANPHSDDHAAGWRAADAIAIARQQIAGRIGADTEEIVFTSGATEANNLAIFGFCREPAPRNRVLVSAIEHKSVLAPARELVQRGFEIILIPVDACGIVDLDSLAGLLDERVLLVSVQLVNNEIGSVQPLSRIAAMASEVGATVHCDAAQALVWRRLDVDDLGVDLLSLSGHKAGGPKGIGALYARHGVRENLRPLFFGGEQEGGLRAGTLPTPLCVGLGAACAIAPQDAIVRTWQARRDRLCERLHVHASDMVVHGPATGRHPGNLSVGFPGIDADRLIAQLQPEIAISRGSACTSGLPEPSHVLRAIGLDAGACSEAVRISVSPCNSDDEIDGAADIISRTLDKIRTAGLVAAE